MKATSNGHLSNIIVNLTKKNKKTLLSIGNVYKTLLKKETPQRTGLLKKSWNKNLQKINKNIISIENKVFYGKFVNYGTSHQKAQNFLEKSINKNKKTVEKIIHTNLNNIL